MSNPSDNSWRCPACGLAPQVRGCAPGKCLGGGGFAIVHAPVRPDAMFFANPGDTFNGHPLSSFCETCRLGILEIGRTERLSVTICAACTEMMKGPPPEPVADDRPASGAWGVSVAPDGTARWKTGDRPPKTAGANDNAVEVRGDPRAMAAFAADISTAAVQEWRWDVDDGFWYLRDPEDNNLIAFEHDPFYGEAMTSYVRAITELAPELEALVRLMTDNAPAVIGACERTGPCSCPVHRARAAVARLDAAKADGRG